jgi:hypothetical protein
MRTGIKFPSERDKFLSEVEEYRAASPEERIEALLELSLLSEDLLAASPRREGQLAVLEVMERDENARWRQVIEAHGRPLPPRSS